MARQKQTLPEFSPETAAALDRVTGFAQRLAAQMLGKELSGTGQPLDPHTMAVAMGMMLFLLRIGPDDLHALFFAEGSLGKGQFKPWSPDFKMKPLFAVSELPAGAMEAILKSGLPHAPTRKNGAQ